MRHIQDLFAIRGRLSAGVAAVIVASSVCSFASASVTWTGLVDTSWIEVAGPYNTITFSEFPQYTSITDQYKDLGVTFTVAGPQPPFQSPYVWFNDVAFPRDGVGIEGDSGFDILLAEPSYSVGAYFFAEIRVKLFLGTELVGDSLLWNPPGATPGFVGGISTIAFDRVRFQGYSDVVLNPVYIDDIVIGVVPAPPSALLLVATLIGLRRRRH